MEVFFSLAFGGGETLSPLKDILVDVQRSVLSLFRSKTSSGINTSFTFSMKCPLILFLIIIFLGKTALLMFIGI